MSVKSLTVVLDDDGKEVCVLSRTLDGHLTGHGVDLRNFLRGFIIKRGSKSADSQKTVANIGRLAALLIAEFHSGTGEFELRSPGVHEGGAGVCIHGLCTPYRAHHTFAAKSADRDGFPQLC